MTISMHGKFITNIYRMNEPALLYVIKSLFIYIYTQETKVGVKMVCK